MSSGRNRQHLRSSQHQRHSPYPTKYYPQRNLDNSSGNNSTVEEDMDVDIENSDDFIKVSAQSNVKAVAGKIAHRCRETEPPNVLCIGAACINQAVKAICISRGYLSEDGWDITFQPAFRDAATRASLVLYLSKERLADTHSVGSELEMPVGRESKAATVAGALAARIREGKVVSLVAIGVDAVANAVLAIGNVRLYLEEDHLDVRAQPEFVTVSKEDRDLNAVKFNIIVENV